MEISLWWAISVNWIWWAWFDFSDFDEETSSWIKKMVICMSNTLDKIFDSVKAWNFPEWLNVSKENLKVFDRLKWLYNQFWDAWIAFIKEWSLNNYRRELFKDAEWFHFIWVSIWAVQALSYVLPIIWIHWEYNSTEWAQTQESWKKVFWNTKIERWIETENSDLTNSIKNLDANKT